MLLTLAKGLGPRKCKVLELLLESNIITNRQISDLLELQPRTSRKICAQWVKEGFLVTVNSSNKARAYKLTDFLRIIIPALKSGPAVFMATYEKHFLKK
ncbi:MAG: hypothetical protein Q8Q60_04880 [Candidatus Chromulinivorax sp.]|nr:hypothetical protein [Candidatus Chromulinivorax sp.]